MGDVGMRGCIEAGCPALVLRGTRCVAHQREYEKGRSNRRKEYEDPGYKRARLKVIGLPCYVCGKPSDTADHVVPVRLGGTWRNGLRPACLEHNSAWKKFN